MSHRISKTSFRVYSDYRCSAAFQSRKLAGNLNDNKGQGSFTVTVAILEDVAQLTKIDMFVRKLLGRNQSPHHLLF